MTEPTMTKREQMLEHIRQNPGCTRKELCAAVDCSYVYAMGCLAAYEAEGLIEQRERPRAEGERGRATLLLFPAEPAPMSYTAEASAL